MDDRSTAFLEVMAALAAVGVISFLIFLVSRAALRTAPGARATYQPRWYELLLAAALVLILALAALWQFLPEGERWSDGARASTFFTVMMIIGGGGLIVFVVSLFWRLSRTTDGEATTSAAPPQADAPAAPATARHQTPSALRLIGLLGFALCFLVLNWAHTIPGQRHQMMLGLIYPAGLIVTLVFLFDKASRAWDIKAPGQSLREWLYINMMLVLYLIAYLNLSGVADPTTYAGMFWDMVHVAAFLLVVWIVDRKASRLRFLLVHAWFIALPILLLIWRSQMGIETPEGTGWWDTVWPFFFLALVAFLVEMIVQIATDQNGGQGVSTFKDVVFLILYVILLISARPEVVA